VPVFADDRVIAPARVIPRSCEVLVIGAGPSGSAAAYWLAEAGFDVVVVEKKHFPRAKTCGDGLTPRSVRQLEDMGLADDLSRYHRFEGLRALAYGRELLLRWPRHPDFGEYGYVITRADLDALVARRAEKVGATLLEGCEAVAPLGAEARAGGRAEGAVVMEHGSGVSHEIAARVVIVADGSNSRFGRALGARRDRALPQGLAIRGYYSSPRHDESWIESHLDLRDETGSVIPGYGWVFPLGDGRVNVGIGILSSFERWKEMNTTRLLQSFVEGAPSSWCLGPDSALGEPTGGRLPMGLSVGPRQGPDYVLVGDAGGSINPFNGEGIAYGYETGRIAASFAAEAVLANDNRVLAGYDAKLAENYGLYFKTASAFMGVMGRPEVMRALVSTGMYSRTLMEWLLRIMSNLLRSDEIGPAELAYGAISRLVRSAG
jgi:geranylgeranyl reductase family protein